MLHLVQNLYLQPKFSRREFLRVTGITTAGLVLTACGSESNDGDQIPGIEGDGAKQQASAFQPSVYLSINSDGIELILHRSEMGQGARTACAMLLAEELEVDLAQIQVRQANGHPKYGDQNTDGSTTVRKNWFALREAGAKAKSMLVQAAANEWAIDVTECQVKDGVISHTPSGNSVRYEDVALAAASLSVPEKVSLKAADFRYIGRDISHIDNKDIVQGKAIYGQDARIPNMVFASIERCPTIAGKINSYSAEKALKIPGVLRVVKVKSLAQPANTNNGLAVIASNTWAAIKGREALEIDWDHGAQSLENTPAYTEALMKKAASDGRVIREEGSAPQVIKDTPEGQIYTAAYQAPHIAHSPMEPPACVVNFNEKGQCEIWAPTQAPQWARRTIAEKLGLEPDDVIVHITMIGGGFGRKSKPDFVTEAAALGQQLQQPVKVVWTREDEIRHGFYRAQSAQMVRAVLDDEGYPTAWRHHTSFPSLRTVFDATGVEPGDFEVAQGLTNMPYRVKNLCIESSGVASDVRLGWLRSVCNTFHAMAVNSFVDELAVRANKDPIQYHLDLLGEPRIVEITERDKKSEYKFDTARLIKVMQEARQRSGWGRKLPTGEGLGFAMHYSFYSYVAMIAHVAVTDGKLKVKSVDCVVDCGTSLNPQNVKAQMEGAVVYAMTAAYYGKLTVKDGQIEQRNFDDYMMLRIPDMPVVNVHLVDNGGLPTGVGEPGVPPVAPAICNAIYQATGKRVRDLPLRDLGLV